MADYKILANKYLKLLEDEVRDYLTKGYKTAGGAFFEEANGGHYFQAVVKYDDED